MRAAVISATAVVACVLGLLQAAPAAAATNTLLSGQVLPAGQRLSASNGAFAALLDGAGNLVVYSHTGTVWSDKVAAGAGAHVLLETNGDIAVINHTGGVAWTSHTSAASSKLVMQTSGALELLNSKGVGIWANGKALPPPPTAGQKIVAWAKLYVGYPYVDDGASPSSGFDCSGLTMWVYQHAIGVTLIHNAESQRHEVRLIPGSQALPGDLIFYMSGGTAYHVAIYTGGGPAMNVGYEIAAAQPGEGVVYQHIWDTNIEFGTDWH